MYLITLDKKLHMVNHRITKQEIVNIAELHKVEVKEIENELKKQIFIKFLPIMEKNFEMTRTGDDESLTYSVKGYILSERQLFEILLEVMDLEEDFKSKMKASLYNHLGIYSQ